MRSKRRPSRSRRVFAVLATASLALCSVMVGVRCRQRYESDEWIWLSSRPDVAPGQGERATYWVLFSGVDGLRLRRAAYRANDVGLIDDPVTTYGVWHRSRRPNGLTHAVQPPRAWAASSASPVYPSSWTAGPREHLPVQLEHWGVFVTSWSYDLTGGQESARSVVFGVPTLLIAVMALPLPVMQWVLSEADARRRGRVAFGRCGRCGYDCRATPEQCPECGAETPIVCSPASP